MNADEIAKWVLALATVIELVIFVIPAAIHIIIKIRDGGSLPTWKHRFSMHAWFVIFWALNTVVFWLSMQSATREGFLETLGGWVVKAQIFVMLAAIHLVARIDCDSPTIPVAGNAFRWSVALLLFVATNVLALNHSWQPIPAYGWKKAAVWTLEDFGAIFFIFSFSAAYPSLPSWILRRCSSCGLA